MAKTKSKLWRVLDTRSKPTRILGAVKEHLELLPDDGERRQDVMHPSEMAKEDWCPRHDFYRITGVPYQQEDVPFSRQNVFDAGHDIHDRWQRRLWDMGVLAGRWKCLDCDQEWEGRAPTECVHCGADKTHLRYREVPVYVDSHRIGGHADGLLEDDKPPALIEIKSIGEGTVRWEAPELVGRHTVETTDGRKILDLNGLWKDIIFPFRSHLIQINLYMWATGIHESVIIYEFKPNQQVKEFHVKYQHHLVEDLLDQALDVVYSIEQNTPPPRPRWADKDYKSCKECPFLSHCYESNQEDEEPRRGTRTAGGTRQDGARGEAASSPRASRRRASNLAQRPSRHGRPRPDRTPRQADVVGGLPRRGGRAGRTGGEQRREHPGRGPGDSLRRRLVRTPRRQGDGRQGAEGA